VQAYVSEYGNSEIALGDLTDFDWDIAVIYSYRATQADIWNAIGSEDTGRIHFGGEYGLVFAKGGKVVYYEATYPNYKFLSPHPVPGEFGIYLRPIYSFSRNLTPSTSVLGVDSIVHTGFTEDSNYPHHWLSVYESEEMVEKAIFDWNNTVAIIQRALKRTVEEAEDVAHKLSYAGVHGAISAEAVKCEDGTLDELIIESENNKRYNLRMSSIFYEGLEDERFFYVESIRGVSEGRTIYRLYSGKSRLLEEKQ
jgi:hypothetical protein